MSAPFGKTPRNPFGPEVDAGTQRQFARLQAELKAEVSRQDRAKRSAARREKRRLEKQRLPRESEAQP